MPSQNNKKISDAPKKILSRDMIWQNKTRPAWP
jgi:hypothetical protein